MVWPERPKAEKGELAGRDAANKGQNYLKADLENETWSRHGAAERWSSPASAPPGPEGAKTQPLGRCRRGAIVRCNDLFGCAA